jgi:hypothetical protein
MRVTQGPDRLDRGLEAGLPAGPRTGALDDLVEGRSPRFFDELGEQIFLKRLAGNRGAPTEDGVHVFWHVLDLNTGHQPRLAPFWRYDMHTGASPRLTDKFWSKVIHAPVAQVNRTLCPVATRSDDAVGETLGAH